MNANNVVCLRLILKALLYHSHRTANSDFVGSPIVLNNLGPAQRFLKILNATFNKCLLLLGVIVVCVF